MIKFVTSRNTSDIAFVRIGFFECYQSDKTGDFTSGSTSPCIKSCISQIVSWKQMHCQDEKSPCLARAQGHLLCDSEWTYFCMEESIPVRVFWFVWWICHVSVIQATAGKWNSLEKSNSNLMDLTFSQLFHSVCSKKNGDAKSLFMDDRSLTPHPPNKKVQFFCSAFLRISWY